MKCQPLFDFIRKRSPWIQSILLLIGLVLLSIVELPNKVDTLPHISLLILCFIIYCLNITFKFIKHGKKILKLLHKIQAECFLIWIVTILGIIFEWGLCDSLGWTFM